MRTVLESAAREFIKSEHLKNELAGAWVDLHAEDGTVLLGIRGRIGAAAMTCSGHEIGCDMIEMEAGSAFPLHTHSGDHVLYILEGSCYVTAAGEKNCCIKGDTVFIPAEYPHGVSAMSDQSVRFLAFGHPHKHLEAKDRMHVVGP